MRLNREVNMWPPPLIVKIHRARDRCRRWKFRHGFVGDVKSSVVRTIRWERMRVWLYTRLPSEATIGACKFRWHQNRKSKIYVSETVASVYIDQLLSLLEALNSTIVFEHSFLLSAGSHTFPYLEDIIFFLSMPYFHNLSHTLNSLIILNKASAIPQNEVPITQNSVHHAGI